MIDITSQMFEFKEGVRHIWNCYFANSSAPMSPATQDAFSDIERALLRVVVVAPHGMGDLANSYRARVLSEILVAPARPDFQIPIRFGQKDQNGNVVWDLETDLKVDEYKPFGFFDFFDWNPYGQVDLPFARVRELVQEGDQASGGRIALIEHIHCKFLLASGKSSG